MSLELNIRFDPAVVEQRKNNILEFLYYCSENPVIYRSQCFVKFFEDGGNSPTESIKKGTEDNGKDGMSSPLDDASIDLSSLNSSIELDGELLSQSNDTKVIALDETSFDPLSTGFDYLYDAAMCFSQAVQEEANLRYKQAFELYKVGIDKLLTGAKNDNNEKRKRIAKTKAAKYLERAEMLYENHIAQLQEENFLLEAATIDDMPSVLALERPVNNLSRFKVTGVTDYIMRVQDCTDKKFYVLKNIYKDSNCTISLPQSIPFMVKLISYYKTESSLFLLLPLVPGGLLWDYINNYSIKTETKHMNLEEIFIDPPDIPKEQNDDKTSQALCQDEVDAQDIPIDLEIDVAEEIFPPDENRLDGFQSESAAIPSFDTLSSEMDINDLMSVSQKLLQSVSKTLEKSQIQSKEKPAIEKKNDEVHINESLSSPEEDLLEREKKSDEITESRTTEISTVIAQLPEPVLVQWASELIVAVNNLHKAGIICGDLNLDNLLLGPFGHLTLTFFYQSDRNEYQQLCRLNPKAIKCHYVAFDFPLTKESDWYSVGVLIYEIMTRDRFYLNHPMGVSRFNEIQFSYPENLSDEIKDLLHGLIIEKAEKRLKYENIIIHPFFQSINWVEVEKCGLDLF